MSVDSDISMKVPKCGRKFSENLFTTQVVNEFVSEWTGVAITNHKDLYGKPEKEKPQREIGNSL